MVPYIILPPLMLCYIILRCFMFKLRYVTLCAVLCYITLCYVTLRYVMLCYFMCYVESCYITKNSHISRLNDIKTYD